MKRYILTSILMLAASTGFADNLEGSDKLLCSSTKILICFEDAECIETYPWEMNLPQFIVVDMKKKTLSTTKGSDENRSSPINTIERDGGKIFLQGIEAGRAFSYVIDELTGLATVAISRDGLTVSVFGACTDAEI